MDLNVLDLSIINKVKISRKVCISLYKKNLDHKNRITSGGDFMVVHTGVLLLSQVCIANLDD